MKLLASCLLTYFIPKFSTTHVKVMFLDSCFYSKGVRGTGW